MKTIDEKIMSHLAKAKARIDQADADGEELSAECEAAIADFCETYSDYEDNDDDSTK